MRNKLSTDINVDNKWKQLNNVLYYGFMIVVISQSLLRRFGKIEISELGDILLIFALIVLLSWGIINIAYRFKPNWFYKKEVE